MMQYLLEIRAGLVELGYRCEILKNPACERLPFLVGIRCEDPSYQTVLTYGHADVVRGMQGWDSGSGPWTLTERDGKLYGRGTADNKGQHTICLLALRAIIEVRGRLGFNSVILLETGEEAGSPGLHEFCKQHRTVLQADVLIASDGPRIHPSCPTVFAGTRGAFGFSMTVRLRDSAHHSGVHGGILASASIILANAIAAVADARGVIRVPGWRGPPIPQTIRTALADVPFENDPPAEESWGEPGLSPLERIIAWNSFEVVAMTAGAPAAPTNAIPHTAIAHCGLRYVVGTSPEAIIPALREFLDGAGFHCVEVTPTVEGTQATRLDPTDPWMVWAANSIRTSTGKQAALLPNIGGTLPNDAFAVILGARTLWIPHSYTNCRQHAPNEHLLPELAYEGLKIMTGLFWDVGKEPAGAALPGAQDSSTEGGA